MCVCVCVLGQASCDGPELSRWTAKVYRMKEINRQETTGKEGEEGEEGKEGKEGGSERDI